MAVSRINGERSFMVDRSEADKQELVIFSWDGCCKGDEDSSPFIYLAAFGLQACSMREIVQVFNRVGSRFFLASSSSINALPRIATRLYAIVDRDGRCSP